MIERQTVEGRSDRQKSRRTAKGRSDGRENFLLGPAKNVSNESTVLRDAALAIPSLTLMSINGMLFPFSSLSLYSVETEAVRNTAGSSPFPVSPHKSCV